MVYLAVSAESGCEYCVGAHSVLARMARVPEPVFEALRSQVTLPDPGLEALRRFALSVMANRGGVPKDELSVFQAAGLDPRQVLAVLTIVAQKTISNYCNHIDHTPLDEMFQSGAWRRP